MSIWEVVASGEAVVIAIGALIWWARSSASSEKITEQGIDIKEMNQDLLDLQRQGKEKDDEILALRKSTNAEISDLQRTVEDLEAAQKVSKADRDNIAQMYREACDNIEMHLATLTERNQRIATLENELSLIQASKPKPLAKRKKKGTK